MGQIYNVIDCVLNTHIMTKQQSLQLLTHFEKVDFSIVPANKSVALW